MNQTEVESLWMWPISSFDLKFTIEMIKSFFYKKKKKKNTHLTQLQKLLLQTTLKS